MDGHRSYSEDPEPRWYPEERRYGETEWSRRGEVPNDPLTGEFPSEEPTTRFRAEAIDVGALRREASASQSVSTGAPLLPNVPVPPPGIPPMPQMQPSQQVPPVPSGMPSAAGPASVGVPSPTSATGGYLPPQAAPQPSPAQPARGSGFGDADRSGVYQRRRPGLAFALGIATCVLELPVLRALTSSALGGHVAVAGIIASVLMMIGLPIFVLGLHSVVGGAVSAANQDVRLWARTPLVYLPIGLALLFAAAIAAA